MFSQEAALLPQREGRVPPLFSVCGMVWFGRAESDRMALGGSVPGRGRAILQFLLNSKKPKTKSDAVDCSAQATFGRKDIKRRHRDGAHQHRG